VNHVIEFMLANGKPMLLSVYLEIDGVSGFDKLSTEERLEIEELLADGTLRLETTGTGSIQ
jgi:hypothetical protein